MLKKRICILISVIMLFFTMNSLAYASKGGPNKIVVATTIGQEITTSEALYIRVNLINNTTPATLYISLLGSTWLKDDTGEYLAKSIPAYNENGEEINLKYELPFWDRYNAALLVHYNGGAEQSIYIPIFVKMTEDSSVILTSNYITRNVFEEYNGKQIAYVYRPDPFEEKPEKPGKPESTTSGAYEINYTNNSSKPTTKIYLTKKDIVIGNVSFDNIEVNSEEYTVISKLSSKGIIQQNDDSEFDLKRKLNTEESLTYLARLLVVNDAVDEKLDNKVIEKYLDKKSDSFKYLATVGSMLKEETLKTIASSNITRELFAQVLYEVTNGKIPIDNNIQISFKDIDQAQYREAIDYCVQTGLLYGTTDNKMIPSESLTNKQMLLILNRLDDKLQKTESDK